MCLHYCGVNIKFLFEIRRFPRWMFYDLCCSRTCCPIALVKPRSTRVTLQTYCTVVRHHNSTTSAATVSQPHDTTLIFSSSSRSGGSVPSKRWTTWMWCCQPTQKTLLPLTSLQSNFFNAMKVKPRWIVLQIIVDGQGNWESSSWARTYFPLFVFFLFRSVSLVPQHVNVGHRRVGT